MQIWDKIWVDVNIMTMDEKGTPYGLIMDGAIASFDGRISWVGKKDALSEDHQAEIISCHGRYMSPGLIDCHSHLIYGGSRIEEFEQRLKGKSYREIAEAGGGILSTVRATRAASEEELLRSAHKRLDHLCRDGLTTVEIKSGYGLDVETELKMMRVARQLGQQAEVDVAVTYLGLHALPPEYKNDRSAYIDLICEEILPIVARENLADAVDGFCENIGFDTEEVERVFECARTLGLKVKLHAEQLSNMGGAALAARYQALSADHLEWLDEAGVQAMAASGTVAVLLPGAYYSLRDDHLPPMDLLRKHNVPMAVATDCNPGSSPVLSLRQMINMAAILFRLTPEEALAGVTREAARALGLADRGTLEVGKKADFALWDISHPAELAYVVGGSLCEGVVKGGKEASHRHTMFI